jgi:hypothetical protein
VARIEQSDIFQIVDDSEDGHTYVVFNQGVNVRGWKCSCGEGTATMHDDEPEEFEPETNDLSEEEWTLIFKGLEVMVDVAKSMKEDWPTTLEEYEKNTLYYNKCVALTAKVKTILDVLND